MENCQTKGEKREYKIKNCANSDRRNETKYISLSTKMNQCQNLRKLLDLNHEEACMYVHDDTLKEGVDGFDAYATSERERERNPQIEDSTDEQNENKEKDQKGEEIDETIENKQNRFICEQRQIARKNKNTKKNENSGSDSDTQLVIQSIKDIHNRTQRHRRKKGVEMNNNTLININLENEDEDDNDDSQNCGLLERNFTNNSDGVSTQAVDAHLEEFIQKKLLEKNGKTKNERQKTEKQSPSQDLYSVPEKYQVADTMQHHKDRMNWVTGLVEVELPLDVKLRNIEATERAKRQLLRRGSTDIQEDEASNAVRSKAFGQRYTWYDPDLKKKTLTNHDDTQINYFRRRVGDTCNKKRKA